MECSEKVEKLKIYLTNREADWCKRHLDFDPRKTKGYVIMDELPECT